MISIILTYHNREAQLLKTLESFQDYKDIEVVIVNDSEPLNLKHYNFDIDEIKITNKSWINPCINFNIGFNHALLENPESVIIQNAECYHNGNIIGYVKDHLTLNNYLSFACYSLGKDEDVTIKNLNQRGAVSNGDPAWYNHSNYRPEALHFCCAIKTVNLRKLNGFDERFAQGLGYEDNYFIHQVRTLGLKVQIIDDPFVFHQYHYDVKAFKFDQDLYNRTGNLCSHLKSNKIYRAEHLITPDL